MQSHRVCLKNNKQITYLTVFDRSVPPSVKQPAVAANRCAACHKKVELLGFRRRCEGSDKRKRTLCLWFNIVSPKKTMDPFCTKNEKSFVPIDMCLSKCCLQLAPLALKNADSFSPPSSYPNNSGDSLLLCLGMQNTEIITVSRLSLLLHLSTTASQQPLAG